VFVCFRLLILLFIVDEVELHIQLLLELLPEWITRATVPQGTFIRARRQHTQEELVARIDVERKRVEAKNNGN
jgi:hypothetical protein